MLILRSRPEKNADSRKVICTFINFEFARQTILFTAGLSNRLDWCNPRIAIQTRMLVYSTGSDESQQLRFQLAFKTRHNQV